jgi:hypothetical protein
MSEKSERNKITMKKKIEKTHLLLDKRKLFLLDTLVLRFKVVDMLTEVLKEKFW